MTPTVSVAIMAHRKREAFIPELLAKLDRPADVVWDSGNNDRWSTGRRSWQAIDKTASHGLVLQDDAVIPRDLVAGVEQALQHVPDGSPVGLYIGKVRPYRQMVEQLVGRAGSGTSWVTMSQLHWGVGIVMPVDSIGSMLGWCDGRPDVPNYDKRISRWFQSQGLLVYYPWPSLVDHRSVRESPSLVQGRTGDRRAYRFLGAEKSALDCDWSGGVVSIPALSRTGGGYTPRHRPPPVQPPRRRKPRLGVAVRFVSTKYPQLQVYKARVRFRGGVAETRDPDAIEELLKLRHMGVEPVEEPAPNGAAVQAAPVGAAAAEVAAGTAEPVHEPATVPAGASEASADDGQMPDGGAKDILAWVGDDPAKARQALDVEQARDKPRTTLAAALAKLAGVGGG